MAKYEDQVARMNFLMEYRTPEKKASSNIEYHANGADGKVYGILKEGTKYYIKTTEVGKENISESYDYIGGFNNRRENEFTDYNKATKQLEFKLMSLNEAYGKHEKTSTVNVNRSEKVFAMLTEDARKEIDRMNQIFENSCTIGKDCICDPESKGKSTGDNTVKNNDPFTEKTEAKLDKDPKFNGTVEGATDNDEVKGVEKDLQSDKNKTANSGSEKDYKDAHDDLDGEGVADKSPSGGKVVKVNVNEDFEQPILGNDLENEVPDDNVVDEVPAEDGGDISVNDFEAGEDDGATDIEPVLGDEDEVGGDVAGIESGEPIDEFDALLEEFEKNYGSVEGSKDADAITGDNAILDKENNPINGTDNGVGDEKGEEWKRIDENDGNVNEPAKEGDEDTMKNYQYGYNNEKKLPAQSWDKLNEAIVSITKDVYRKLMESKKPAKKALTLKEAIEKMVKEEITKLDAWGKHPRFRKEPMTTPDNKEVLAGTAKKDWNDDSAKGEQPYGQKIGDGKPFDELVNNLTDKVLSQLKESLKKN